MSILGKQIADLKEEINKLKLQKPKMSIKDIIDDTEKVSLHK